MTQGEKHMNRRRKSQFREALDAKREALASAAKQPKQEPEPGWEPETPEIRAEVLADRLNETTEQRSIVTAHVQSGVS
jgi:hypothetical protein